MAKMWPRRLPADIQRSPLRSTECRVFHKLDAELGSDYVVFYSRPWHGLTRLGEEIDGECDFLVAHPQHGILCLEVKGGRIRYTPEIDQWTSLDRHDITHIIKNPIAQASKSKYHLLQKFINSAGWPKWKIHITHGVIFPDCEVPAIGLGADGPREIFCDRNQFVSSLGTWVKQRLRSGSANIRELGKNGLQALEDVLAKPVNLHRPLAYDIEDNDEAFFTLTQGQFIILNTIQNIKRAAISGGAGTGKTVLAVEEAIRCAQNELTTLLICFNIPLAQKIRHDLQDCRDVQVYTFHALCGHMAKKAGLQIDTEDSAKLYEDVLPEALLNAAELVPQARYDAIIVDEGQDFKAHWWPAIDSLLRERHSKLRIFWDCNQAVYGSPSLPEHTESIDIPLDKNLRNSRQIFATINRFYKGPIISAAGPDGPPVEWRITQNQGSAIMVVADIIRRMFNNEGVNPSQLAVAVDVQANELISELSKQIPKRKFNLCNGSPCDNSVTVDTVKRLKGLEFSVLIVVCTDSLIRDNALQYIAFSRARTKLVIVGRKDHLLALGWNGQE
ncbi:NERD domain-containing protein [Desulfovibrio sp. QI0430]